MKHFRKPWRKQKQASKMAGACKLVSEDTKETPIIRRESVHNVVNALFNHFRRYKPEVLKTSHFTNENERSY